MPGAKKTTYTEAVGRRKTAVARVRLTSASKMSYAINDKNLEAYFPTKVLQKAVARPFAHAGEKGTFAVSAHVRGGGIAAQATAVQHGIARALTKLDGELRTPLKGDGLLKRDPRSKERRKFGLKKARRAPQWSKR